MPWDPTNPFAPDDRPWWQSLAAPPTLQPNAPPGGLFGNAFGAAASNNWPSSPNFSPLMPGHMAPLPLGGSSSAPTPPDPFTSYWSRIPTNSLRPFAPIFPDALAQPWPALPTTPLATPPVPKWGLFGG